MGTARSPRRKTGRTQVGGTGEDGKISTLNGPGHRRVRNQERRGYHHSSTLCCSFTAPRRPACSSANRYTHTHTHSLTHSHSEGASDATEHAAHTQGILEAALAAVGGVSLRQLHLHYAVHVPGLLGHMEVCVSVISLSLPSSVLPSLPPSLPPSLVPLSRMI
jgi:hypothetical protein